MCSGLIIHRAKCTGRAAAQTSICGTTDRSNFIGANIADASLIGLPVDTAIDRMGVNVRLMTPEVIAGARVRHLDGADTEQYVDD